MRQHRDPSSTIEQPSRARGYRQAVFHRYPATPASHRAVGGDGIYIIDEAGKRYLDGSSGSGISCLGHSNEAVRRAMHEQLDRLSFAHTSFFSNAPMEELAAALVSGTDGLGYVWFTNSGAEAFEAALKLARQYFLEIGENQRQFFVGRRGGYLGSSIGALAVGGNAVRKRPFEPLLPTNVAHIDACYPYRGLQPGETLEAYARRTAMQLEEAILKLGPSKVAAFVCETVVGSTAGVLVPPPGYFRIIREICDKHGVLLILDEVMCGMGRVGSRYAFEQEGIVPDMVMLGKGLAGGYAPLGAVVLREKIHEAVRLGAGYFRHGQSSHGHALACAAGLAVQQEVARMNLVENSRAMGERLGGLLHAKFGEHPHVGDIRGRGLMWALELVADRDTKRTFEPHLGVNARIKDRAFDLGLICYTGGGMVEGGRGDHVMIMPPLIIEAPQLEELVAKLSRALELSL